MDETRKIKHTELKDYEDYCDHCGKYGPGIEFFDGESYHVICYTCIDTVRRRLNQTKKH